MNGMIYVKEFINLLGLKINDQAKNINNRSDL